MRIEFVEIANFRKLLSARVGFSKDKTVFVGANNSGKTSAMVALRYFLVEREREYFSLNDFTLSSWPYINVMGEEWEKAKAADQPIPPPAWEKVLPSLDVWLHVEDDEIRYVHKILPTLDWVGGLLGVRLRFEPKAALELQGEYLAARANVTKVQAAGKSKAAGGSEELFTVSLWPQNLTEFLGRRLGLIFEIKAYVLDPIKCRDPEHGLAQPQPLARDSAPIDGNPLKGLIRIDEISAQRGFGYAEGGSDTGTNDEDGDGVTSSGQRKLSEQLRQYYRRHLDPSKNPDARDLHALKAIEDAQKAFDGRLQEGFSEAIHEMETMGYPGVTDPRLSISTLIKPVDGLKHKAAVQYVIPMKAGKTAVDLHLPEDSIGLGYQNLISMVFRLMSFRDAWMRVRKAETRTVGSEDAFIPPLHLVLIEEPEAHLHTQVQQVFIRQAYKILRAHNELGAGTRLTTQLVVSTHSSHLAHECEFKSLRYFRRMPAKDGEIPTARIVNLTNIFGDDADTERFVTRYLQVTHCDLFFADAIVLIEGPAERILIPHFIRNHVEYSDLLECYITWLEIGGSHAHRLRNLIEHLGLTTLIITDLDAIDEARKSVNPIRACKQLSRNATLKSWCPATAILDELLEKTEIEKTMLYGPQGFSVRVAYQCPITISFKGATCEALANTFEDALVFHNIELFSGINGNGLLRRFKQTLENSTTIDQLGKSLFDELKEGDKAELAMDLLELKDPKSLKTPAYINEGLLWLAKQLRTRQAELGIPLPNPAAAGERVEKVK